MNLPGTFSLPNITFNIVTISNPNYKFSQETGASIEAVLGRTDEKYVIMINNTLYKRVIKIESITVPAEVYPCI